MIWLEWHYFGKTLQAQLHFTAENIDIVVAAHAEQNNKLVLESRGL